MSAPEEHKVPERCQSVWGEVPAACPRRIPPQARELGDQVRGGARPEIRDAQVVGDVRQETFNRAECRCAGVCGKIDVFGQTDQLRLVAV